jgi:hypothetical protein
MGRRTRVEQDELGPIVRRQHAERAGRVGTASHRGVTIVFLTFVVIALVAAGTIAAVLHGQNVHSAASPKRARHVVIFLVDGASSFPVRLMPTVNRLARAGTSYDRAWIGQWPSVRPASGATTGTGVFPRENGILGASWLDPTTAREIQPTAPGAVRLGSIDQILESRHLTPIAAAIKDRNPGSKVLAVGGVGCAPADAAASWLADYVLCIGRQGHRWVESAVIGHGLPPGTARTASVPIASGRGIGPQLEGWQLGSQDDQITQNAIGAIHVARPQLTIIEFPEPAAVLPFVPAGRRSEVTRTLLTGVDGDIERVESALRADRLLSGTAFVVTSGEAVSPLDHTEAVSSFSDAVIAAGGVPVYVHGGAAAAIALQDSDPQQAQSVAQAIEASQVNGIDAIFYRTRHGRSWGYQLQYLDPLLRPGYGDAVGALLSTAAADEAPDVVAVYAPHTGTGTSSGSLRATGESGGFTWDTQHIPLVVSGAGVGTGQISHFPARLVDLAPTVESLLGITPVSGDGVVLADALATPAAGAGDAQRNRQSSLTTIIDALAGRLNASG